MVKKTALIVDDDENYRHLLAEFLADYDYSVRTYSSPLAFINDTHHCQSRQPCFDIIITDNQMPGMNGIDFLQLLNKISCKIPDGRKVLVSGYLTDEIACQAKELGSLAFKKLTAVDELSDWLETLSA